MPVKTKLLCTSLLSSCLIMPAQAGGIYVPETGSTGEVGYAAAGMTARAEDASTVFTNPAGMSRFDKENTMLGGVALYLHAPFHSDSNTTTSGSGNNTNEILAATSFGYVRPLNDKWSVGISAQNNFGLALNWGNKWKGRYQGSQAILIAPQIQPTVAYKIDDAWSVGVGAGLTLGYFKDKVMLNTPIRAGDGTLRYSDTDVAVQGNLGVMFEPSADTRLGVRYLTETKLKFKDNPDVSNVGTDLGLINLNPRLDLAARMPQSVIGSVWQRVDDRWALLGSIGWDDWSRFGEIGVNLVGGEIASTVDVGFKDTWHLGLGAEYQVSNKLTYTGGISYDSAMASDARVPIVLPVGSTLRLAGGAKYASREDLTFGGGLELAYMGDFGTKTYTRNYGQVSGEYSSTYILAASFYANWK